tara:strand:+ start:783 stop:1478 length:696 start_codon:yes stop_codon:yes gene_type:complete
MEAQFPVEERYYILKQDESLGPFEVDEILQHIEAGLFNYDDVCLREGASECERLRDVLDWDEEPKATAPIEEGVAKAAEPEPIAPSLKPGAILYQGHPSILSYPIPFLGLIGGVVGAAWLYPLDGRLTLICLIVTALSLIHISLMRFTSDFLITPLRIELITGLIARSSNEVRIADIRAINVSCRGFTGILGIGTVEFFTVGDSPEVSFRHVFSAKKIKDLVRRLQDSPTV